MYSKSIAIIDHVGCKAGMDSYSGALASGFVENGVKCFLFSNFKTADAICYPFFQKKKRSKLSSVMNQSIPFWKAAMVCRQNDVSECIIHFFSFEIKDIIALRILRFYGLKIIGLVHDIEHLAAKGDQYRGEILSSFCDKIMVHNAFSKTELLRLHPRLHTKIKIIPHMNFHNLPQGKNKYLLRKKWGLCEKRTYLLFFGQIKDAKGLDILLHAMPKVKERVDLIIAGKIWQTNFNKYQQIINEHKLKSRVTTYLRFITDMERDELFTASDIIVLPYKKIFQSGVMQVAMSYKLPIIASNIVPFRNIMKEEKYGYLFETEDVHALSNKINEVVNNLPLADKKVQSAYTMAKNKFSNKNITQQIIHW